jgi:uroporphyrinogen decarboxylase
MFFTHLGPPAPCGCKCYDSNMRLLAACARMPVDATPVWFMRQAGRCLPEYRRLRGRFGFLELCERPEAAAEATLQPVRRFGVDAAIVFSDILLPARPMGLRLRYVEGRGPSLEPPVRTARDIDRLKDVVPQEDLGFVLETLRLVRRELDGKVPVIGFAGAPFTLACYLIEGGASKDQRHAKVFMRSRPELWSRLMAKLTKVAIEYLRAQVKAGAQALQVFDSWAGALSKEDYARAVRPYSREVLAAAEATGVPVIHFGTGNGAFLKDFSAAGRGVVGVDWREPLDEAWQRIGRDRAVQGNLDPAHMLLPLRELKASVFDVLRRAGGRLGHIFNLGHGMLPGTPPGHAKAVVDWVHEASL